MLQTFPRFVQHKLVNVVMMNIIHMIWANHKQKCFEGIIQYKLHQYTQFLQMYNSFAPTGIQSVLNYFRSLQGVAIRDHSFFVWLRGSWWDLTSISCSTCIWWPRLILRNFLGGPSLYPKWVEMTHPHPPKKTMPRERLKNFLKKWKMTNWK